MSSDWMADAFCAHFPSLPWISEPEDRSPAAESAMAVVCLSCPVLAECRAYAGSPGITSGFWAGEDRTPVDRDQSGAA